MSSFRGTAAPLSALLTGVALLLLGTGLLNTLLSVRAVQNGLDSTLLGLVMSAYFVGFILGTFLSPVMIRRVGHIRTFACCAAVAASTVLGHALTDHPGIWMLLRALTGISLVGLYAVIESWLAARAQGSERGRVFALYMIVNLLALAAGQFLMLLAPAQSFALFALIAMLVNLSLVPIAFTRLEQPLAPHSPRLHIGEMVATAPTAAACALLSGLAMGAFWGMLPAYVQGAGAGASGVAIFMSTAILGGAALQWPLGRLSDGHDRRETLRMVALAALLVAVVAGALSLWQPAALPALMFLYGGLAFAAYPIGVAHLSDRLPAERVLEGASVSLLLHGAGAAIGPALAGVLMSIATPSALFLHFVLCWGALAAYTQWRLLRERPQPQTTDAGTFIPMLRTSPVALEMLSEEPPTDDPFAAAQHERVS
ncbi:MFS transporter [Flagellatimonas centrodinii]|uniref:MFS transporter n=1 Tax=Flagellatimonas centrodinii TaxID=2806210 RepID=UPI001FFCDDE9|nr:MFS transporter [Flagellatimonas centrodinii]ULQ46512.1 MFS transporter [Flagellatimonas centrodinii]